MQYHLMTDYYFMMLDQMIAFYKSVFSEGFVYSIIILVIGAIFASEFGKLSGRIVKDIGLEKSLEKAGVKGFLKKGGVRFSVSSLVEWIIKWFILLFALNIAVESLGLPQVSGFLSDMLGYMPNLIGAVAILSIGLIVSQMVYEALEGASNAVGLEIYHIAAIALKTLIIVITFLVVLEQVGIQTTVLQIFAGGLSLMMALAGGLAFGLGGQYHAKEFLDEMKSKLRK